MDNKEPKRSLQDSNADARPAKRHSPSSAASPSSPYATSYTSAAPRSTNMGRPNVNFNYFTEEADDSDDEQSASWARLMDIHTRSSPLAADRGDYSYLPSGTQMHSHAPAACPGTHALETLQTYQTDPGGDEGPSAEDSPPGGVAVALEAATRYTRPRRSASPPPESRVGEDLSPSTNGHKSRDSPPSSADGDEDHAIDLRDLDPPARGELYRRFFSAHPVPLGEFDIPDACREFQDLAEEILAAYVDHTTFTVKVWANYDSAIKKLYREPNRTGTCGRLQLPATQRKHLNSFHDVQFSNIVVEVGNPFRTLFEVHLRAVNGKLHVGAMEMEDVHGRHVSLASVVKAAMERIADDGVVGDQHGLTLQDLDLIAKEFVYLPKTQKDCWNHFAN